MQGIEGSIEMKSVLDREGKWVDWERAEDSLPSHTNDAKEELL